MDKQILDFLTNQKVCVLTTLLPNGSPHSAALHYSHINDPLTLYFSTDKTSRKTQGLLDGQTVKSSVVVGFSEGDWITLQMDGDIRAATSKEELKAIHKVHYAKRPGSEKYKDDPVTLFLAFVPKWWRYSDSKVVLSSEGS